MEPLPTLPAKPVPNEPRNLLARLYREIGVSAVAAALAVPDPARPREEDAPATPPVALAVEAA